MRVAAIQQGQFVTLQRERPNTQRQLEVGQRVCSIPLPKTALTA